VHPQIDNRITLVVLFFAQLVFNNPEYLPPQNKVKGKDGTSQNSKRNPMHEQPTGLYVALIMIRRLHLRRVPGEVSSYQAQELSKQSRMGVVDTHYFVKG
jgi:hypothetical protein